MSVIQRASRVGVVLAVMCCWGCGAGSWKAPPINGEFLVPAPAPGEEGNSVEGSFDDDDDDTDAPEPSPEPSDTPAGDAAPTGDTPASDTPAAGNTPAAGDTPTPAKDAPASNQADTTTPSGGAK